MCTCHWWLYHWYCLHSLHVYLLLWAWSIRVGLLIAAPLQHQHAATCHQWCELPLSVAVNCGVSYSVDTFKLCCYHVPLVSD
jgi:hypothetical protein